MARLEYLYIDGLMLDHLMYADDLVILSPSARSMQMLLSQCDKYAELHDIIYNTKTSVCMCIKTKNLSPCVNHSFLLSSEVLTFVTSHKYLGVIICADMADGDSIRRQCKSVYARGNVLLRLFKKCSDEVKFF